MKPSCSYSANLPSRSLLAVTEEPADASYDEVLPISEMKIEVDVAECGQDQLLVGRCEEKTAKTPSISLYRRTPYANQVMLSQANKLQEAIKKYEVVLHRHNFPKFNNDPALHDQRYFALCRIQERIEQDTRFQGDPSLLSYAIGCLFSFTKVGRCDDYCDLATKEWLDDRDKYKNLRLTLFEYANISDTDFDNHYFLCIDVGGKASLSHQHDVRPVRIRPHILPDELQHCVLVDPFFGKSLVFSGRTEEVRNSVWERYVSDVTARMGHPQKGQLKLSRHCQFKNYLDDEECVYVKKIAEQYFISYLLKDCKVLDDALNLLIDLTKLPLLAPNEHCRDLNRAEWTEEVIRALISRQIDNRKGLHESQSGIDVRECQYLEDMIGLIFEPSIAAASHKTDTRESKSRTSTYLLWPPYVRRCTRWLGAPYRSLRRVTRVINPSFLSKEKNILCCGIIDNDIQGNEQVRNKEYYYATQTFWFDYVLPNLKMIRENPADPSIRKEVKDVFLLDDERLERWLAKYDSVREQKHQYLDYASLVVDNMNSILKQYLKEGISLYEIVQHISTVRDEGEWAVCWERTKRFLKEAIEWMKECNAEDQNNDNSRRAEEAASILNISLKDVADYPALYDQREDEKVRIHRRRRAILDMASEPTVKNIHDVVESINNRVEVKVPVKLIGKGEAVTFTDVKSALTQFLNNRRRKRSDALAKLYLAEGKQVDCWLDNAQKFEEMSRNKYKGGVLEMLPISKRLFLRELLLNYFAECQKGNPKAFGKVLRLLDCKEKPNIIRKRLELLKPYFINESARTSVYLIKFGFSHDEIAMLRRRYRDEAVPAPRVLDQKILRLLFNPENRYSIAQVDHELSQESLDFHHSAIFKTLNLFRRKIKDKTPEEIASFYHVSPEVVATWKDVYETRKVELDNENLTRKRKSRQTGEESVIKKIKLEKAESARVDFPDANVLDKKPIAGPSQAFDPLEGIEENTKLTRIQLLDRFYGTGSRPLHKYERNYLLSHCTVSRNGAVYWLTQFSEKMASLDIEDFAEHYRIPTEKAETWHLNQDNDNVTFDKGAADRAMLLATFGAQANLVKANRRKIAQNVVLKHPMYSSRQAMAICTAWENDDDVKERKIDSVRKTYGFEYSECETLVESYLSSIVHQRGVEKSSLSKATSDLFRSFYEDSTGASSTKGELISRYLTQCPDDVTESELITQFKQFEKLIKKGYSADEIAKKMSLDIGDVNKWLVSAKHKVRMLKDEMVTDQIKLYDRMWGEESEPITPSYAAAELALDVKWVKSQCQKITKIFNGQQTIDSMSECLGLPLDKVKSWNAIYHLRAPSTRKK
ncbi:hypothetical protein [Kistimonas asteriae]|uniref:hypothetical protein n=1 Tax=Kistimonas asteriae TaxID=517724 RepID=UPI001BA95F30|nr:hypothetical protein [Kistimonas asteriae]